MLKNAHWQGPETKRERKKKGRKPIYLNWTIQSSQSRDKQLIKEHSNWIQPHTHTHTHNHTHTCKWPNQLRTGETILSSIICLLTQHFFTNRKAQRQMLTTKACYWSDACWIKCIRRPEKANLQNKQRFSSQAVLRNNSDWLLEKKKKKKIRLNRQFFLQILKLPQEPWKEWCRCSWIVMNTFTLALR